MSVSDELLRRLIELQEQQVAAINRLADKNDSGLSAGDLLEQFSQQQAKLVNLNLENDLPRFTKPEKAALPSKMELAKQWLKDHPEDRSLTGRDLSAIRFPQGVEISHVYWNKAKQEV